jgi:hypothetical protein
LVTGATRGTKQADTADQLGVASETDQDTDGGDVEILKKSLGDNFNLGAITIRIY